MQTTLRDHPFFDYQGVRTWPPTWLRTSGKTTTAVGEVGILQDVKTHDLISSKCFLFIEYDGATFVGRVSSDSSEFCQDLVELLRRHRGETLEFIGGLCLELTDTPVTVRRAA
jgi:hypothetical protein